MTISENLYNTSELKDEKSEHHNQIYWFIFFGIKIPIMTVCIGIAFFYTRKRLKKETSSKLYFIIEINSCLIFLLLSVNRTNRYKF